MTVLAITQLTGCVKKIQLPPRYGLAGSPNNPPVIEVQNVDLYGHSNKSDILSTTAADPEIVTVTPDSAEATKGLAQIMIEGTATDNVLGIRFFQLQVTRNFTVIYDVVAQQFVDANNKVYPSLGIIGTDGSGGAGFKSPIDLWPDGTSTITVRAIASNFGLIPKQMTINYICPTCPPPAVTGGGTVPIIGGTPPTPPSSCQRMDGPFAEVNPGFNTVDSTLPSPSGTWSATIKATNPGTSLDPYIAVLKSGSKTYSVPFTVGSLTSLLQPAMGGVGFTANSARAVIATYTGGNTSIATHVSFQIADSSKVFSTMQVPRISVYEKDPSASPSTLPEFVQPRIFFSPDATLALVLSAPVAGTASSRFNLSAYDLCSGVMAPLISGGGNISADFVSATVSGKKIQATLSGPPTTVSFTVP